MRSAERDAALEAAIVGYFVDAAALLGVPKSVAAIYGICFARAEPLSFAEIQARLDLSAGSISQGLKVLREMGALKLVGPALNPSIVPTPFTGGNGDNGGLGDRNPPAVAPVSSCSNPEALGLLPKALRRGGAAAAARYAPDLELRRLAQHFLEKRVQPQLAAGSARLTAILGTVEAGPIRARLEHLANWHAKADGLLPLVTSFLEIPTSDSAPA